MPDFPIKLPSGVDWHGPHDPLVRLMTAIYNNCPSYHGNCGILPKSCLTCNMICDQRSLDRLMAAYVSRTKLKEWGEVDRENFELKRKGTVTTAEFEHTEVESDPEPSGDEGDAW
jgi:hypothetical protein